MKRGSSSSFPRYSQFLDRKHIILEGCRFLSEITAYAGVCALPHRVPAVYNALALLSLQGHRLQPLSSGLWGCQSIWSLSLHSGGAWVFPQALKLLHKCAPCLGLVGSLLL